MLYRLGGEMEWEGKNLSTLIAADPDAEEKALADGWRRLPDLLARKPKK